MTSTQQRRLPISHTPRGKSCDLPDARGTLQGSAERDRQPHHDHLQRVAVNMGWWLQPVANAPQHSVNQLEIGKAVAEAFDGGERLDQHFLGHEIPQQEARGHHHTTVRKQTDNFRPKIRKSIPQRPTSEQFYASSEHPCIHQDQERHSDQEQREHKARDHHVILCNTACFATRGSVST